MVMVRLCIIGLSLSPLATLTFPVSRTSQGARCDSKKRPRSAAEVAPDESILAAALLAAVYWSRYRAGT